MPKIIVTDERHSKELPVGNGGRYQFIPVGVETLVDEDILEALTNSSISFETVGDEGGSVGGVLAEPPSTSPLAILDLKTSDILAAASALSEADIHTLIEAEKAGKTRKGVLSGLEALATPEGDN